MTRVKFIVLGFVAFLFAVQVANAENSRGAKQTRIDIGGSSRPQIALLSAPLSFEPNVGQSEAPARFLAHGAGYAVELNPSRARVAVGKDASLALELVNGRGNAALEGREQLPGKADYFPTSDPKSWHADIPTYARVRSVDVYPGIDVEFYGDPARLEYDFLLRSGADPALIRMALSGAGSVTVNGDGDLVLHFAAGDMNLLKPVAWQLSGDGKTRTPVQAGYRLEQAAHGKLAMVTLALGAYDHSKPLTIDPALVPGESLMWAAYLTQSYVSAVAADSSGNSYVTGYTGSGFYVTELNPSGTVLYSATIGSGLIYPYGIAVDGTGRAYVVGQINNSASIPTSSKSYQKNQPSASNNAFYVQVAAGGGTIPYATYLGGNDSQDSFAYAIAVDSVGNSYIAGETASATFPTTSGVYQTTHLGGAGSENGFVAKINPAATTATASLAYSLNLGPAGTALYAVAINGSGDAYVTGNAPNGFPITAGAFQYAGYESTSGGVYVTELNPTATALVYSAYLGYGTASSIAVDGSGDAYVTGVVGYDDFPTTPGAYQTTYAGGFVTELAAGGATEVYSTFLGGPSSYSGSNVTPEGIALTPGCSSNCNAYVAGYTTTTDFPAVNAFQLNPSNTGQSAFVVELAGGGGSALFSSYLSGLNGGVEYYYFNYYGFAPTLAVDPSGNILVVGNLAGANDFPVTIPFTTATSAFLAKIGPSASGFVWGTPSSINFGSQPVGVPTSVDNGTQTVLLRNVSTNPVTLSPIVVAPPSIFTESDNCGGAIAAGGYCTLDVDFTPGGPGARNGSITIASNAADSTVTIPITGTGYDGAIIQTSVSALTFPSENVGTSSPSQTVTLTNIGNETANLSIYNYYVYYYGQTDFSEVNNCPSQLKPGDSCQVFETFTPSQVGLISDTLEVSGGGPTATVQLEGAGMIPGAVSQLVFTSTALNLGNEPVGSTTGPITIYFYNNGTVPLVIQSISVAGDFSLYNYGGCGSSLPFQTAPQLQCYAEVTFTPSATGSRTGSLTIVDDDPGSPYIIPLTGFGVASTQTILFNPATTIPFPDQPIGYMSGAQFIYTFNTGTSPLVIDRVLTSGPFSITGTTCPETTLLGTLYDGSPSYMYSYCFTEVQFAPTATGPQTGALTFYDSSPGSPHVVNLTGNAILPSGTVIVDQTALNFGPEVKGVASSPQYVNINNPGNTSVNVTSMSSSLSDYAITSSDCGTSFTLTAGEVGVCWVAVTFTPTASSASPGTTRTGTLTIYTSAGNYTVSLTGAGITSTQALGVTPTTDGFGSVVTGNSAASFIYLRNTGTVPVTFTDDGVLTGTDPSDFTVNNYTCPGPSGTLAAGASCYISVNFSPGAAGSRSATLTFHSSAAAVAATLNGAGVAKLPVSYVTPATLAFNQQPVGTVSPFSNGSWVQFINYGATAVALGNVAYTGQFMTTPGTAANDTCSGQTLASTVSCSVWVSFAPTSAGYLTGTLTFKNSAGTSLASTALAGYAQADVANAYLDPQTVVFPEDQVVNTTSNASAMSTTTITLFNAGSVQVTVGTLTGANLGASPANEFSINSNGATDYCSGKTLPAGSSCTVSVSFTPNAPGSRTGTIVFPVTYAYTGGATVSLTANVSGNAVPEKNSAVLSPTAATYVDTAVGQSTPANIITLTNSGNLPFNVGTLVGTNTQIGASSTGEFSAMESGGGYDNCSGQAVQPGNSCSIAVSFTPSATGQRSGSVTFGVTFADSSQVTPAVMLRGNGVPAVSAVQILPTGMQFPVEIKGTASSPQIVSVTNIGNVPLQFGTDSITTDFVITSDSCNKSTLAASGSCSVSVSYAPSVAAPETGTLTIADNATGGPHTVALSGTGILANQQVAVSPTALAFGSQPAGSTSSPQAVTVTNQSNTALATLSVAFATTNASSYQFTNNCGTTMPARSACTMAVVFAPAAKANGALPASFTIKTPVAGQTSIPISITGTAVPPGPYATLSPAALTFTRQNVGSTSKPIPFSVTNTGSANLVITNVASSNFAEFPLSFDGCSGATLTPEQSCTVSARFAPSVGGPRSSTISVFDNAPGSPQTLAVSGTGYGIPQAVLTPSDLTFTSQNIGTTSLAAQNIVLSNPGSDALTISAVALVGSEAGDFAISANTCAATLAPSTTCTISITFTPTAPNHRSAGLAVTDNAGNLPNSTQIAGLDGTGVAVPQVSGLPPSLTFAAQNIGSTSAAQVATMTDNGTGYLSIASIVIGGANPGDFAQTGNCGQALPKNESCNIAVTFTPTAAGARSATITITDNAGNVAGTQQMFNLYGTGQAVPGGSVIVGTLNFGNQNVNVPSASQSVTLYNGGSGPLTISAIAIVGMNAADFSLSPAGTCPVSPNTLAAVSSCFINVTFTPAALGGRVATLSITDNAGNVAGTVQPVVLYGNGLEPLASPSVTSLAFGNQNLAEPSAVKTVILTNTGNATLGITSIVLAGTNPGDYSETTTCGSSVQPGKSCNISVAFNPQVLGSLPATLTITDNNANAFGSAQHVALSGTGVQEPVASLTPSTYAFGNTNVGQPNGSLAFTLSNTTGEVPLAISSIGFTGKDPADFTVSTTSTCAAGGTVAIGSSCTIFVTFEPQAAGARSGTLVVTDNSLNVVGSTQSATLTGTGLAPKAALSPALTFTSQGVGTPSASKAVTLSNSGTEAMTITAIGFAGTDPGDYSETDTCAAGTYPATLAISTNCTINVTFNPATNGSRPATLVVTDNSGGFAGAMQSVNLAGTGSAPEASITPTNLTLTFAAQTVGTTSSGQSAKINNSGSATMNIASVAVTGAEAAEFPITNNCGATLAAAASCTVTVHFKPSATGAQSATLNFTDNANNGTGVIQSVTLNGTGQ